METMTTTFASRPHAAPDSFIFYAGPPSEKARAAPASNDAWLPDLDEHWSQCEQDAARASYSDLDAPDGSITQGFVRNTTADTDLPDEDALAASSPIQCSKLDEKIEHDGSEDNFDITATLFSPPTSSLVSNGTVGMHSPVYWVQTDEHVSTVILPSANLLDRPLPDREELAHTGGLPVPSTAHDGCAPVGRTDAAFEGKGASSSSHSDGDEDDSEDIPFIPTRRHRQRRATLLSRLEDDDDPASKRGRTGSGGTHTCGLTCARQHRQSQVRARKRSGRQWQGFIARGSGSVGDREDTLIDEPYSLSNQTQSVKRPYKPRKRRQKPRKSLSPSKDRRKTADSRYPEVDYSSTPTQSPPRRKKSYLGHATRGEVTGMQQDSALSSTTLAEQPMWAVKRIMSSVYKHGELLYKVRWEDTWEPAESMHGCADTAIAEYHLGN